MLSQSAARWLQRHGIHYGWLVAGITFLTMLTMSAALGLPGAMLQPLSREFGWTTDQISTALALRFALFGLMGPFAAVLMERWGLRAVMCLGLALVGTGMALVTLASQLWQLFVLWSLLLGLGTGLTALVLGAVVANRWFVARRGLVVGLLTASAATGQLAFLPFAAWMIEHWGGVMPSRRSSSPARRWACWHLPSCATAHRTWGWRLMATPRRQQQQQRHPPWR